jgi:UDP-glucose 4-epimerase
VPRERLGSDRVVASDIRAPPAGALGEGPFAYADATRPDHLERLVVEHGITHVIHFSALLSAVGERNPQLALDVNIKSVQIVLELGTHTERERERRTKTVGITHRHTWGALQSDWARGAARPGR